MEENIETLTFVTMDDKENSKVDPNPDPDHHRPINSPIANKRRSPFHVLKAILYLLRKKSANDSKSKSKSKSKSIKSDVVDPKSGFWRSLLGSMRPMHAQNNMESPPPSFENKHITSSPERDEFFTPPRDETALYSSSFYSPECDIKSQYTSAWNLQELEHQNEETRYTSALNLQELDDNHDQGDGDEMIDTKAEEFITQFYQQIRLQRSDSTNSNNVDD